jgi:steroid delta-isomerase-like uncharacterized protein
MSCDAPQERVCRLVRQYVAAWNSHDVDRLTSLFSEDASYGEFGLGRIMLGQEEIRRHLIATFTALPDLSIAPTGQPLSSGERVFWQWLMTATHKAEFGGVLPTGKRFALRGSSVLLTNGDDIVRAADCFDVSDLITQAASDRVPRWNSDSSSTPDPSMYTLADEDNIGYGE